MYKVKCIKRIKDDKGAIVSYLLLGEGGEQAIYSAEAVKRAIRENKVKAVNLTLTSDNRLILLKDGLRPSIGVKTIEERIEDFKNSQEYASIGASKYEFEIVNNKVWLKSVPENQRTYIIPEFVNYICGSKSQLKRDIPYGYSWGSYIFDDDDVRSYVSREKHKGLLTVNNKYKSVKVINLSGRIQDLSNLFAHAEYEEIDVSLLNLSKVTDVTGLFAGCKNLKNIKFGNNTDWSNIESAAFLFAGCTSMKKIDISELNLTKVKDLENIFRSCSKAEEIKLSKYGFPNLHNFYAAFSHCRALKSIDFSTFANNKSPDVVNLAETFCECNSIESIDISYIKPKAVEAMHRTFAECTNLKSIKLFNNIVQCAFIQGFISGCDNLKELDISSLELTTIASYQASIYQLLGKSKSLEYVILNRTKKYVASSYNNMSDNLYDTFPQLKVVYIPGIWHVIHSLAASSEIKEQFENYRGMVVCNARNKELISVFKSAGFVIRNCKADELTKIREELKLKSNILRFKALITVE